MNQVSPEHRPLLPPVNDVLAHPDVRPLIDEQGRETVLRWVRHALSTLRDEARSGETPRDRAELSRVVADRVVLAARRALRLRLGRVINATGVILHTSLGRAPLSKAAISAIESVAAAANLEMDLENGERRSRGFQLHAAWSTLTGADDSLVVNNNAAGTLLALSALAKGREVVISRGQLIEIGGSFRLPEIFQLSGAVLREVGTTNRTRLSDYEQAIGPQTAAVMRVHPSNYRVVGFSETPDIAELAVLAHQRRLPIIDDIGSGCLIDVARFQLPPEPTFRESLTCGADVVLGSGDKLLGGPQCGIVLGKAAYIDAMRKHPLARAVRVDKLTLAALSATLDAYLRNRAESEVPTLCLLDQSPEHLHARAESIRRELSERPPWEIQIRADRAPVGGGSLPGALLPTWTLSLSHGAFSAETIARRLRLSSIPVLTRIQQEMVHVDLRSVLPDDDAELARAIHLLTRDTPDG